jgi:hypothetical protein
MKALLFALALIAPTAAWAQDDSGERDYCPARPGLGSPACTIAPGRVSVETALADWTLEKQGGDRTDTILFGDTLVRAGISETVELQLGWTPVGVVRDRSAGLVDHATRVGDVTLGAKVNLAHPDGSKLAFAIQPYVSLPVGRAPVGAGDWGAGLVAPLTYDLTDAINLEFTPEIDAAVNASGHGRHLAYSGVIGVGIAVTKAVTLTLEDQVQRDDDPSGGSTQDLAGVSLAWMARKNLQLDIGGVAGVSGGAPNAELYLGVSRRF